MKYPIGPQYTKDNIFKAAARLHQSRFRSIYLNVDYDTYGNRLTEQDARSLLNYYSEMNVRAELRKRYPHYSKARDSDMLRSEHIPFNVFAPLKENPKLTQHVIENAFGVKCSPPFDIRFEWAPSPRENYLNDGTAFDTYIQFRNGNHRLVGIGVEVKYTEQGYKIGKSEAIRVKDKHSTYWTVTKKSGLFIDEENELLGHDDVRQIWRNHLLGLSMQQCGEINDFVSIILYPTHNDHFHISIPKYQRLLKDSHNLSVRGCTFEKFIKELHGDTEIENWRTYLMERYLIEKPT